jgi:hypothetical protein
VDVRLAALVGAAALATAPIQSGAAFLQTRQQGDGSFAESGQPGSAQLTAWAELGLKAAGQSPKARGDAIKYLVEQEPGLTSATDIALVALAEQALGQNDDRLLARLRALERPSGSVAGLVNATAWTVLALKGHGSPVPRPLIRWLLSRQTRAGGWSWSPGGAPDSNDTAAVVEALRSARIAGPPIRRALRFLLRFRNRDGGFALTRGDGSDAQSTAWVAQAFIAAGRRPPQSGLAYLRRLQRPDGSFRYSARYATTPVWVTSQVLPALAGKAFPLS